MMKIKRWFSASMCIVLLFMNACTKNPVTVTNLPPGVSQAAVNNWLSASTRLDQAFSITHTALSSCIAARNGGLWTDNESYAAALKAIGKALQLEGAAADALKQQPNAWSASLTTSVSGYVNEALTALRDVTNAGTIGIK